MRIPRGWRYDGVWAKADDGDGCPYFESVFETVDGDLHYAEQYEKACTLVSWEMLGADEMPDECANCPDRPKGKPFIPTTDEPPDGSILDAIEGGAR